MIDQETRDLALRTFRDTLTDPLAKPADKLRAAEGIMRLEAEQKDQGLADALDATDDELLKMAREGPKLTTPAPEKDNDPAQ